MNARISSFTKVILDGEGNDRTFQFSKLPALTGILLGKKVITRILPLFQNLTRSGGAQDKKELKDVVKNLDSSILDKITLEQVAQMLEGMTNADMEEVAKTCLTSVYEVLPAQSCQVMDEQGHYQVEGVEYDPVMFITLIWEELKFGLSDFFKGDRWLSLLPKGEAPAVSSPLSPA